MSIHTRLTNARHAALALIEHTLATATDAILAGDASPATLREARIAATAAVRALDALERTLDDDEPAPDPADDPRDGLAPDAPRPARDSPAADTGNQPPVSFPHADLLPSLGLPGPFGPADAPRPRSPAALLQRAGATHPRPGPAP